MVEDQELREQSTERERLERLFYYVLKGLEDFFSGHTKTHIRWDQAIKSTLNVDQAQFSVPFARIRLPS